MTKSYFLLTLALIILFTSCVKNSDVFVPNPGQQLDSAWVSSIQSNAQVVQLTNKIAGSFTTETVSASVDTSIRTNTGFTIEIPKGSLLSSGNEYTGSVRAEFILIQKKGDFIRYGVPSMNNRSPLESGSAFFIRFLSSANNVLTVNTGKRIYIKYTDELAKQGMSLFYSSIIPSATSLFNWLPSNDGSVVSTWSNTGTVPVQKGFVISTTRTGWLSAERALEQTPVTDVNVVMPDLFSNANTAVFMVFKSIRSVVQLGGNNSMRSFSCLNTPLYQDVKFVTISKVADSYYLGIKEEKISANHSTFVRPELSSLEKINQFLNSL
jgi:hypothetical protein